LRRTEPGRCQRYASGQRLTRSQLEAKWCNIEPKLLRMNMVMMVELIMIRMMVMMAVLMMMMMMMLICR
jgi:hypothetical protein